MQVHLHGRVFEEQRGRLNENGFIRAQVADEGVARRVQEQQTRRLRREEAIHEPAERVMRLCVVAVLRCEPNVRREPIIGDAVRRREKDMFAHVHSLSGLYRQCDQLAGRVAREGYVSGAVRLRHDERQASEETFPSTLERHRADLHLRVHPEQDVMREIDAITRRKVEIRDRHILALDLQRRMTQLNLRHIKASRHLYPAGLRGNPFHVYGDTAARTGELRPVARGVAPGTGVMTLNRNV